MFGFSAISEYPISDFPVAGIIPPPTPILTSTDGFTAEEARRYQNLLKRYTNVSKARDKARVADAKRLRQIVEDAVDPKPPAPVEVPVKEGQRPTLKRKSLPDLNGELYRLELQMQEYEYKRWQYQEYQRLQAQERERQQEQDDLEALLLLL